MLLSEEILQGLPDKIPALQSAYQAVEDKDPVHVAKIYGLSQQTGIPEPVTETNYDKIKRLAETPSLQYWKQYERFYPNTTKYLSDPKKMATAKDLTDKLGQEETIFTQAKVGYHKGKLNVELAELAWQQMLETLATGQRSMANEERIRELEAEIGQIAEPTGFKPVRYAAEQLPNMIAMAKNAGFKGAAAGMFAGLGAAIMGQLGPQAVIPEEAVTVPAAFTAGLKLGGGFGAAEQAAILEAGSAYREFIHLTDVTGQPIDPQLAAVAALAVGVINAGLESVSLSKLLQTIPGGEKVTQFLAREGVKKVLKEQTTKGAVLEGFKRYLIAIGSEMATEFMQESVTQLGGEAIKTSGDFERKSFGEIVTDSARVLSPTAQSTMLFGLPGFGTHIYQGMRNVQQAHIDAQTYEVLGQVAEQSEYLERLPEGWRTLAEMHTKGGALENIYIDTEQFTTLLQDATGVQGEEALNLVAKELGIEDQVQEALDTNKPLSIPYAVWLEKVVKTPLYQAMQPHIKFSEDGITLSQAEAVEQRTNELIQQEQQRAEEFITRSEVFKQGYDEVYADVKQKLIEAGRPEKIKEREWNSYVDKAARLWAAHAVAEASKRDITPQEWYKGANKPEILSAGESAETVATAKEVIELPPQAPAAKISALAHPVNRMTMDERKYEDLSDPKIMSYQFLHPELADYIQSMATYILGEVRNSVKGERFYTEHEGDITITGTSKYVSETVQRIQDETGATYAEITQALQNIIEGKGAENTALAKKIELILDDNLTEGYTTFEGIEIPPDMDYILAKKQVEQKLKKQSTYSQDSRAPRAQVRITPERSIITLFATADASSFIHESAHIWLNDIFQYAKEGTLNEQYQEEWNILTEWLGIAPDQEQLTTEQHEKFARSFERYLMEAKAPSLRLRKVFAAFRRWLTRIYRDAAALDVEISDEVRGIMDRLLATEEEIREAALYDGFAELGEQARLAAEERLLVELMSELSPERKKAIEKERQRAEDAARRELTNDPLYSAIERMKSEYKLNTEALEEQFGKDMIRRLPKEIHSKDGTYTADMVADIFGFTSGDELIKKIVTSPSLEQAIQQRVELALTKHASMMITGQVKNVARESLRNEYALELIALEKATLESMLSGEENINKNREIAKITAKAARRYAKGILASKPYKKATAAVSYFAAERDAAVKAERARKNNNLELAAQYTNQRMLNHALAIEALNNKKEIDKMFRYFKRVAKEPKKRPSIPLEYRRQMYSLLERFMLKPGQANMTHPDRISLFEFVTKKNEEYHNLPIPERLLNEQYIKDYRSMTLEELREVYAGVKTLDKLGRYENRFYSAFIKTELNEAAREAAESIKKNAGEKYAREKKIGSYKTFLQKLKSIPDDINAWLLKTEFIVRYLDGNTEGPMHKYFWNPLNNAFKDEIELKQKVIKRIKNVVGQFYNEEEMAKMSHTLVYIPALEQSLTKEEIILCALNMGNAGNLDRLQRGYNLSDEQIAQIKAQLTKKDWDMVQAIWDYLDSFWPAIKKLEEEVTGIEPEQVEPLPVETPFGTYRGGYFPIDYDPGKSAEAFRHDEQLNALYKEAPAAYAATKHGHTKRRARSVERPLNLRWNTLTSHLVNVIHDLTHRKAIIDANRFLKHKEVRQAIENAIGVKGYRALEKSLISIASDQRESMNFGDKAFRWLRSRTTLRFMGMNLRVALLQVSGFFHTMDEIGFIPTMRGMMTAMSNPQGTWNFVKERSAFMRDRARTFDRDIYDMSRRMFKNDKGLQNFAFSLIGFMDMVVSVPTWVEAYKIGLSKFQDETQAVEYADGVIRRTQGTGAVKDLAAAQRGNEMQRMITMFYSFGNVLYNRFWLAKKTAERQWTVGERQRAVQTIARATFYNWILPGMFEFILREALRNEDNDDLDEILKRFGISMVSWPLQAVPIIRDIGQYLIDKAFGMYSTFRISPIESTVESMGKVVDKARKIIQGDGEWLDLAEGLSEAAGFYTGLPQQVDTWVFNFLDWIEDNGEASWRDLFTRRRN